MDYIHDISETWCVIVDLPPLQPFCNLFQAHVLDQSS